MDDDERETARAQRRDVIESNNAWASAETVRRTWLRGLLTRKTAPKGTGAFLAAALAHDGSTVTAAGGNQLAAELLGCTQAGGYGRSTALADLIEKSNEARALLLALAQVLAGYEDCTDRSDWRTVRPQTTRYLRFLQSCGYALAPVERRARGQQPIPDAPSGEERNDPLDETGTPE